MIPILPLCNCDFELKCLIIQFLKMGPILWHSVVGLYRYKEGIFRKDIYIERDQFFNNLNHILMTQKTSYLKELYDKSLCKLKNIFMIKITIHQTTSSYIPMLAHETFLWILLPGNFLKLVVVIWIYHS